MKNLNKLIALLSVAFIMGCGNGKNATSTTGNQTSGTTVANRTDSNVNDRSQSNTTNAAFDPVESKYGEINEGSNNSSDYDTKRWTQVYTDLNMTDNQIERFENDSRTAMDAWKTNNTQSVMNSEERLRQEGNTMKLILNPSQYSDYQQWLIDNPYRN